MDKVKIGSILEGLRVDEAKIKDPKLKQQVDELAKLKSRINQLEKELKPLQGKAKKVADEILPALESLGDKIHTTEKSVLTILRKGYEAESTSYKKLYEVLLTKVNKPTRDMMEEMAKTITTVKKVSASYDAEVLDEGLKDYFKDIFNKVRIKVKRWFRELNLIDKAVKELERMADQHQRSEAPRGAGI